MLVQTRKAEKGPSRPKGPSGQSKLKWPRMAHVGPSCLKGPAGPKGSFQPCTFVETCRQAFKKFVARQAAQQQLLAVAKAVGGHVDEQQGQRQVLAVAAAVAAAAHVDDESRHWLTIKRDRASKSIQRGHQGGGLPGFGVFPNGP